MTKLRRNLIMAGVAAALLGSAGAAQAQPWGYDSRSDWRYSPVGAIVASPFIALGAAVSPYHAYHYGPRYGYRTAAYDPYYGGNSTAYLNAQARYDDESQRTQLYVDPHMGLGSTAPDIDRRIPASELNIMQAEMRDHYWGS